MIKYIVVFFFFAVFIILWMISMVVWHIQNWNAKTDGNWVTTYIPYPGGIG